jgi:NADP-dependent 3-hydroxy acid dehydrogenase YdfG
MVIEQIDKMRDSMDVLQPDDIANAILFAVSQPPRASINEILVRPSKQTR